MKKDRDRASSAMTRPLLNGREIMALQVKQTKPIEKTEFYNDIINTVRM